MIDVAPRPGRHARVPRRGAPQQRWRRAPAAHERARHRDRAPRARSARRRVHGRRRGRRALERGVHVGGVSSSAHRARRDRAGRERARARGTWSSYSLGASFAPGDRVLTSRAEYASNVIGLLQLSARTGASVEVVPDDESGQLSVDALRGDARRPGAAGGDVVDPHAGRAGESRGRGRRGRRARRASRTSSTPARPPVSCRSTSTRSGATSSPPPGASTCARPAAPGSSTCADRVARPARSAVPRRARRAVGARVTTSWCGPTPVASRAGSARSPTSSVSGRAVDYALELGVDDIAERVVQELAAALREQLADVAGLTLHDRGVEQCGIVTFTVDGVDVYELAASFAREHINISVSTIDFARYDFEARGLDRRRPRVGALLQHRGGAHAPRRLGHCTAGVTSSPPRSRTHRFHCRLDDARRRPAANESGGTASAAASAAQRDRGAATSSSPPAPATSGVALRGGSDATASAMASALLCRGAQPSAWSRSLAITHGCTR